MALDQRAQAEALVQLAREQEPSIGGHRGPSELDAKLGIEREANRARCRVTHWVVPSASARSRREPRFLRVLNNYGLARSPFKSKMRALNSLNAWPSERENAGSFLPSKKTPSASAATQRSCDPIVALTSRLLELVAIDC